MNTPEGIDIIASSLHFLRSISLVALCAFEFPNNTPSGTITALANSQEFSVHKFYHFLKSSGIKVGKNALYNYLSYLNDALIVFPLRKFAPSYKESEQSIPKIYFVDNGLLRISGIQGKGRLLENLVFVELLRRGKDVSYYKTPMAEVDFVVREGRRTKQLIQTCFDAEDYSTRERELKALARAGRELGCRDLLVITWDESAEEKCRGKKIRFVPLWKWLLFE